MTKLNSDTAPEAGKGTDADRLSQSPQAIRHGNQDVFDLGAGDVQTDAGQFNYDKNTLPMGVEPGPGPRATDGRDCSANARRTAKRRTT